MIAARLAGVLARVACCDSPVPGSCSRDLGAHAGVMPYPVLRLDGVGPVRGSKGPRRQSRGGPQRTLPARDVIEELK